MMAGRPRKVKTENDKIRDLIREQVNIIVENAKLLSTGKLRNTFFLEKAARELTRLEGEIQKSNN
jgi:hypothetical protein